MTSDMAQVIAVDPTLFASLDPPRLAGAQCVDCSTVTFPAASGCAKCAGAHMAPVELADHGTLWTYTVQEIEPKAPYRSPQDGFVPFAVGYVDLGDVVVETRLVGDTHEIGAPMTLTLLPLWDDVVTYAFGPAS
jgi:uncharacterized OB-fold protein